MVAGASAGYESRRQTALAEDHERAAHEAREMAARYNIASITEKSVARRLAPLSAMGYTLLPDRGWPGSRRAQIDLVLIGPGGLFIVDTKAWADVSIHNGRIYRGQDDCTEDLAGIADLAYGTEEVMADIGLPGGEVRAVAVLAGKKGVNGSVGTVDVVGEHDILSYVASRGQRLTATQVNLVLQMTLTYFPVVGAPAPVNAEVREPVLPAEQQYFTPDQLASDAEVGEALMAGIFAAPIEDWMSFLHPHQARVVRREYNGPSRIRGAAGTGKTVVGLHRAAYLARSLPGTVLVTTYVNTLPAVLASLMQRMAPEIAHRVEFVGTHAFAKRLLDERGIAYHLDPAAANLEFEAAWREVGMPGALSMIDGNSRYWKEEIDSVIKGRGILQFEVYADLARTGRRRRLSVDQRRAMWSLYVAYQNRLVARGIHDFADIVLLAEASLRAQPSTKYSAVIVDEAQDLSCSMIRMLHHLVGNRTDGLTLIGDGQQTIYPGGFTLGEAGISLAGRGVVMDTNYRNTAEILGYAASLISGDEFADIEGLLESGDAVSVLRAGAAPLFTRFTSRPAHDAALVAHIQSLGTSLGDIAVLAVDKYALASIALSLSSAGIPFIELTEYDGTPVNAVKVGTVKRAKGLEFKQVLLAQVRDSLMMGEVPTEGAALERYELNRRELYVAMTRARDGLWVGSLQ